MLGNAHLLRGALITTTFVALAVMAVCARSSGQTEYNDEFVQRDGTRLTLGGETFRYSGPNIEWLGVEMWVTTLDSTPFVRVPHFAALVREPDPLIQLSTVVDSWINEVKTFPKM